MRYVKVLATDELPEGGKRKVELEGKTLLMTRIGGACYAIDNRCPHMGGSLYDGQLKGDTVSCPRHGTAFSVKTGKVRQNGRIAFIRLRVADVKAYPVQEENGEIWIGVD